METSTKSPTDFLLRTKKHQEFTPVELEVAKACAEIAESSTTVEAKAAVSQIKIVKALEIPVEATGKKALLVHVRYTDFKEKVRPAQQRIIQELEKKTKRHVLLVAARTMMKKNTKRPGLRIRPRSRTLTAVHDAWLEDLVAPTEVVGRRVRVKVDGSKTHIIHLDPKDRAKDNLEEKLETFAAVYRAMTSKVATFGFPESQ